MRFLFMFTLIFSFVLVFLSTSSCTDRGIDRVNTLNELIHQNANTGTFKALVIGIDDYADSNIADLETAENDAVKMADILRSEYGFEVTSLIGTQASKKTIYDSLRDLANHTKPTDSILIYYAGHGDLDRLYDDGWWIPQDATHGNPLTYLENVQVQRAMKTMNAKHVLLISDSCYSGTLFGKSRGLAPKIDDKYYLNLFNEKSRWGITSGNKTPVSDTGAEGHSVFAYQLLKVLKSNDKPYLSTQEIYTSIAPIIANINGQQPLCGPIRNCGDQGGGFVFIKTHISSPHPSSSNSGGYELFLGPKRVGHEPDWSRPKALEHFKWYLEKGNAATAYFNGEKLMVATASSLVEGAAKQIFGKSSTYTYKGHKIVMTSYREFESMISFYKVGNAEYILLQIANPDSQITDAEIKAWNSSHHSATLFRQNEKVVQLKMHQRLPSNMSDTKEIMIKWKAAIDEAVNII